jgi:hypothetical protein
MQTFEEIFIVPTKCVFRQGYLKRVIALFHLREYSIQKIAGSR